MSDKAILLSFGRCQLNLAARELTVDDELVDLQPLVFDLLAFFAQNPGRVLGKDELLKVVWRSPFVTDSVVARAVMKARRAVMDDARAPRILHTVQRVGYRFDALVTRTSADRAETTPLATPQQPLAKIFDLAVLPWTGSGTVADSIGGPVACLVHHLLERQGESTLLPMADLLFNGDLLSQSKDLLATACHQFGAREAVAFEVKPNAGDQLLLLVQRGSQLSDRREWRFVNTDIWDLALQAVPVLSSGEGLSDFTAQHRSGLQALGKGLYQKELGHIADALSTLKQAHTELPASPWLDVVWANVHASNGFAAQVLPLVLQTLARSESMNRPDLKVQLLRLHAQCAMAVDDAATATKLFQAAYETSSQHASTAHQCGEDLGLWIAAATKNEQPETARRLAEQSLLRATAIGHPPSVARAHYRHGTVLVMSMQTNSSLAALHKASQLARQCRQWPLLALALRWESVALVQLRRYREAIEVAQEGLRFALEAHNGPLVSSNRMSLLRAYTHSEQVEAAEQVCKDLTASGFPNAHFEVAYRLIATMLDRKQDRHEKAIADMQALLASSARHAEASRKTGLFYLAGDLIHVGRLGEAADAIQRLDGKPFPNRRLAVEAQLALAEGRLADCIEGLRKVWNMSIHREEIVTDAGIDLAWLLMEGIDPAQDDAELESLVAHILDCGDEYPAANLMIAAYLLRRMPNASTRARWDSAVRRAKAFARRYPDMTTASFRESLENGTAPRAPKLLTRMCQ